MQQGLSESPLRHTSVKSLLKQKWLNGWSLFWLVSIPMCVFMVLASLQSDFSTGSGISHMIGYSVRWAVPFIFIVTATSALQTLFPGPVSMWLLRNRKFIGLLFAVAMAWQGLFIYLMSTVYRDYYFEEVYLLRDELEGSVGYIFLALMVVTSFRFGRRFLDPQQWKFLHRTGVYFLWAYPFATYWWSLYYYENPRLIDHVFYWLGFTAFALRIAAWGKNQQQAKFSDGVNSSAFSVPRLAGTVLIAMGVVVAATGLSWRAPVADFLRSEPWSAKLELWLPFWPFEPFYSLALVGAGTWLATLKSPWMTPRLIGASSRERL